MSKLNVKILTGSIVSWQGPKGEMKQGEVTGYRHNDGKLVLQILMADGRHLWMIAEVIEGGVSETFCVLKHSATSIEYGLQLADLVLSGKGSQKPINFQMTTLAATVAALQIQYEQLCQDHAELALLTVNRKRKS